jgi:phage/conjugal plasmid C-4 type zinc finger TraR family protein
MAGDDIDQAQIQIEQTTAAAIASIVSRVRSGPGSTLCMECGDLIPARRRDLLPSATRCVDCQRDYEAAR